MVYFITDGKYTKVGYSENVEQRFKSLQTSNPRTLELWHTFEGGKELELQFHAAFQQFHHRGEWFKFPKLWHFKGNPRATKEAFIESLDKWLKYPEAQEAIEKVKEAKHKFYKNV